MAKLLWRRYKWKQFTYWNTECMTTLNNKFQLFPCSQRMLVNVTAKMQTDGAVLSWRFRYPACQQSCYLFPPESNGSPAGCHSRACPLDWLPDVFVSNLLANWESLVIFIPSLDDTSLTCMHSTQKMFMELWDCYWCMTFHLWRIMVPDLALQCQDPWGWGWLLSWQ